MDHTIISELSKANLGDVRLNSRLLKVAQALAMSPEESINASIGSFHDCKGAYRLFANSKVSPEKILSPHISQTVGRASEVDGDLLVVHDTTDLLYPKFKSTQGLSAKTTREGMSKGLMGMMLHNSLLITPSGTPLGLTRQKYFTYEDYLEERGQETRNLQGSHKEYPIEKKASLRWLESIVETENACKELKNRLIHVADREGDIYELLQQSDSLSIKYVIRSMSDRRVKAGKGTIRDTTTINRLLAKAPELGQVAIEIKDGSGKTVHHTLCVKSILATLHPPQRKVCSEKFGKLQPVTVSVVELCSVFDENFHWRLLTNLDCHDLDSAIYVMNIYKRRWLIETYHRVLKSGYKVESARLNCRSRLENFCALGSVLAWRMMWLYLSSREWPSLPCSNFLSEQEMLVLSISKHSPNKDISSMTITEAVWTLAKLGGFLGRKSDGEPGMTSIWKGWRALYERLSFLEELTCG